MTGSRPVSDIARASTVTDQRDNWFLMADPGDAGTIAPGTNAVYELTTTGSQTRTVAAPVFNGQMLTLVTIVSTSDAIAVTFPTDINGVANNNVYNLDAVGDIGLFLAIDVSGTLQWRWIGGGLAAGGYTLLA